MDDSELAAQLAHHAGRIALAIRDSGLIAGRALGDAGDEAANRFLCRAIAQHRPDDGLLSEESTDTETRLGKDRVWIIDPVDGTREYGEGRGDWAVHIGLAIGGAAQIGAVALPGLGLVLRSDRPAALPAAPATPRMVVSRSRPPAQALAVAEALGAELVPMGSAGAKAMTVVRGEAEIYLHAGGQHQWDNCAPAAVAAAHGLHVSRIDGAPLVYNSRD
ncbi:MAG: 3'(2'),5'-bisphosphate nucleotidase CysQ, partial [Alphaproteobacteria bacterium]|nr:3'(2'),5'-bisphosphate nucleotidase CysQ [Alphaproteobacteria bacterium]